MGGNLLGQTLCLLLSQGQVHVQVSPDGIKECGVAVCVGGAQTWARGFNKNGTFGLRIFVERAEVKFKIRKGNRGSSRIKGQIRVYWGAGFTVRMKTDESNA